MTSEKHFHGQSHGRFNMDDAIATDPARARLAALDEIKKAMGPEPFYVWFNDVHKLRAAGNQAEYEAAVFGKAIALAGDEEGSDNRPSTQWREHGYR
jgi:hypothetical protein